MQKAVIHIRAVIGRIIFIGLSIQVVLGILWMCCSFTHLQWFADESTGILYPFLLMITGQNTTLLCLLQVALALAAGFCFVGALGVKKSCWRVWGSLVLLTYPFALQCHMAVLPNSFAFSCFLLQVALTVMATKKKKRSWMVELFGVHVLWLGASLLQTEYLYLGAVPVVLFWLYDAVKYCKKAGWRVCCHLLLIAAFAGLILSINQLTQSEGENGKSTPSVEATIFKRIAWSSLEKYYFDWPEDIQDTFTTEEFQSAEEYVENMDIILLPQIESKVGLERAKDFYRDMSLHVLKNNYYQIIYEVGWDALGNLFPVIATDKILGGSGYHSGCVRNYENFRQDCPALACCYMNYEIWWFPIGMVLAVIQLLLGFGTKKKVWIGKHIWRILLCAIPAVVMTIWYTIVCVGRWDYKNGLFVGILWIVWMTVTAVKGVEEEL